MMMMMIDDDDVLAERNMRVFFFSFLRPFYLLLFWNASYFETDSISLKNDVTYWLFLIFIHVYIRYIHCFIWYSVYRTILRLKISNLFYGAARSVGWLDVGWMLLFVERHESKKSGCRAGRSRERRSTITVVLLYSCIHLIDWHIPHTQIYIKTIPSSSSCHCHPDDIHHHPPPLLVSIRWHYVRHPPGCQDRRYHHHHHRHRHWVKWLMLPQRGNIMSNGPTSCII